MAENQPEVRGLMPKNPGSPGGWQSRDFELPIVPCRVVVCACNAGGMCEMPSAISINGAGSCETGLRYLATEKRDVQS